MLPQATRIVACPCLRNCCASCSGYCPLWLSTSCIVTDNAELIIMRDALGTLLNHLAKVIWNLSNFAMKWKGGFAYIASVVCIMLLLLKRNQVLPVLSFNRHDWYAFPVFR